MIVYWIIFAILSAGCLYAYHMDGKWIQYSGTQLSPTRGLLICLVLVLLLSFFAAARSPNSDHDYLNYIKWLSLSSDPDDEISPWWKDPLFQLLGKWLNAEDGSLVFLMLFASLFSLAIKLYIFRLPDLIPLSGMCLFFVFSRFYLLHEFTQIRAVLAISLVSLSLVLLMMEHAFVRSVILFLLAAMIHASVIVVLPLALYLLRKNINWQYFGASVFFCSVFLYVISLFFGDQFLVERIAPYVDADNGIKSWKLLNLYFLLRVFILSCLLLQWNRCSKLLRFSWLASTYGVVLGILFSWNEVLALRFSELFAIFDVICIAAFFAYFIPIKYGTRNIMVVLLGATFFLSSLKVVKVYALL